MKNGLLKQFALILIMVMLLSVIAACAKHMPEPAEPEATEEATEAPTEALTEEPTEEPTPTPTQAPRIITAEPDEVVAYVEAQIGAVEFSRQLEASLRDPKNADCLFYVRLSINGLEDGYRETIVHILDEYYQEPIVIYYDEAFFDYYENVFLPNGGDTIECDENERESIGRFHFKDYWEETQPEEIKEAYKAAFYDHLDEWKEYGELLSNSDEYVNERRNEEYARLAELGYEFEAGRAYLTKEQILNFPGLPQYGYMLRRASYGHY